MLNVTDIMASNIQISSSGLAKPLVGLEISNDKPYMVGCKPLNRF